MRKIICSVLLFCLLSILGCAGTGGGIKNFEEPREGNCIIVGNVIVENINQEFAWYNWDFSATVVVVGKNEDGTPRHYTVTTDDQGYYCLPNVPAEPYALKAVILPMFGGLPVKLVNDLSDYDLKFYRMSHPEQSIEYTAEWLPAKTDGRILDFGIVWMGLREADIEDISGKEKGKVLVQKFSEGIKNKRFYSQGYVYSRENPVTYFKNKFPNSAWWKQ